MHLDTLTHGLSSTKEIKKTQSIRLLDVVVLGPAMVYAGMGKPLPQGLKILMLLTGVGTIIYNGYNWNENRKHLRGSNYGR